MRVLLDDQWPTSAADLESLQRIILRASDSGVHLLLVTDADAMERWGGLVDLGSNQRELLRAAAVASTVSPVPQTGPHRYELEPAALGWSKAAALMHTPVWIVVESQHTDGVLVDAALRAYGDAETQRLRQAGFQSGSAMSVDHSGGIGDAPKTLNRRAREAQRGGIPLRAVVMVDSDGRWPGDRSGKANKALACADGHGCKCVVLSKRAIENYVPDEVWDAWSAGSAKLANVVAALKRLAVEARDHLPMKSGFSKVPQNGKSAADKNTETAVYAAVAPADRKLLAQGIPQGQPKKELIAVLDDYAQHVTAQTLDARDHQRDLRSLVDAIEALL